jgi:hypothetical protein
MLVPVRVNDLFEPVAGEKAGCAQQQGEKEVFCHGFVWFLVDDTKQGAWLRLR